MPLSTAITWLNEYFDADMGVRRPYAYPAYDTFDTRGQGHRLEDGELLVPALLNVSVTIKAYYELQRIRADLQRALAHIPDRLRLQDASDDQVLALVSGVYAQLDRPDKPVNVGPVILSKILHRRRPEFLMLFDRWVRRCYTTAVDAPVPRQSGRTWARYMSQVAVEAAQDLRDQAEIWGQLEQVPVIRQAGVTPLRLLDVLAWRAGQQAAQASVGGGQ